MPIFRKQTPEGGKYVPNAEPPEEYTGTLYAPSLTRRQKRAVGLLPRRTRLPGEAR